MTSDNIDFKRHIDRKDAGKAVGGGTAFAGITFGITQIANIPFAEYGIILGAGLVTGAVVYFTA